MSWGEATDNVQVTGYHLQQLVGGSWTTIRTVAAHQRFQTVSGLTPGSAYSFAVIAFDAAGNTSVRSDPGGFTTLALTATPACRVQVITFSPGFQATVTIVNTTSAATNGWTIGFDLPATASTGGTFNGVMSRSGGSGTITPAVYNAAIAPGVQSFVGFSGSAAPFTPPSGFTLNGLPCTG
ncbi:hypothetical protein Aple_057630 [Acrocarpospora pleiomorpha]|uniref:Fibronectin type-III domain-containing protein n=1 Tax=Acrocarpospora pleiomorpha TaxID=90975 RepID=A0A5M3XNR6_9ACTN|nr:hypothetical protein Aple_057630 [Acrocarpospora pleiomorpha]